VPANRKLIAHRPRFRLGHKRRDRIDDDDVDTASAPAVGDFEPLLTCIGLRDQEIADVDAELARVNWVERVLGIDIGSGASRFCTCATTCSESVVLPASGLTHHPATRRRRRRARCRAPATRWTPPAGRSDLRIAHFMIEPLPNCFSICASAAARLVFLVVH
jgi:hypothetical protein